MVTESPKPLSIQTRADRTMLGKTTGQTIATFHDRDGRTVAQTYGATPAAAKESLLGYLAACAERMLQHTYIFCGDGLTVLHVFATGEEWAYNILSSDRVSAAGCYMNCRTRKEAEANALAHAIQSYGGVLKTLR